MRFATPCSRRRPTAAGFTLLELIIVVAIVGILAAAAMPLARWSAKRNREYQLQQNLRILRSAIDRYHDAATAGVIEVPEGTNGFPATLEALVEGVPMVQPLPTPVPISDVYNATGPGLTGGLTGLTQQQPGAAGDVTTDTEQRGLSEDSRGLTTGSRPGLARQTSPARDGQPQPLVFMRQITVDPLSGQTGPAEPLLGPDGEPLKLVFLRRIPRDPFTGEADWGVRCYGEPPDDRLWCGKDVFDVFSKSIAKAIDGSNYRDW